MLVETEQSEHRDATATGAEPLYYRVATVRDFSNPLTGESLSLQGPLSEPVRLEPLPPLTIAFTDAAGTAESGFWQIWDGEPRHTVSGRVLGAFGTVTVAAESGRGRSSVSLDGDRFELSLLVQGPAEWRFRVQETGGPGRQAEVVYRFITDNTAPDIEIHGPAERTTTKDYIVLEGRASDARSGLADVRVHSDRYAGQSFQAFIGAGGAFTAELPLQRGMNLLTATAVDRAGNSASAQVQVMREVSAAPRLLILNPPRDTTTRAEQLTVSGVVYSSQASDQLRVSLGDRQQSPDPGPQDGAHVFSFAAVPLQPGTNQIAVAVASPAGNDRQVVSVFRDDSPEREIAPPTLEITSPSATDYSNQERVIVAGNATSTVGVAQVTVNNEVVAVGGRDSTRLSFRHSIELSAEGLEIVVVAEDIDGRSSRRTINLQRDTDAPVIVLERPLAPAPEINTVVESPYRLRGR
ncbi:hypothetical protein [Alkalilimnicola ehrlichii]|uniref:hypothetical protein n=1 Tax=Alkalilimnicola ehrlichii TaxID=351052 RepID=UPI0011C02BF0|nr:hypothetical protein [Alkalilimnicola ehrlichii]